MLGTIVNTGTIILGCLIGGAAKKVLGEKYNKALFTAMGLGVVGLGLNTVVSNMPDSEYPVLFIASMAIGTLIGTALDLDGRVQRLSERKAGAGAPGEDGGKKKNLGTGIVTASLLFCVGTLSILGPVQSALYGDNTFLFTNAMLDLVTATVFASGYGVGMIFSAGILFAWQGSIYGLTMLIGDFISQEMMTEVSIVGGLMIVGSGLILLDIKDCKTLNMLPSLFVPVIWILISGVF